MRAVTAEGSGGDGPGWAPALAVLAIVALIIGLPMVVGRTPAGHDLVVYLINAQQTAAGLRGGELFPAWGGGFNAGFGAPTLLFFPPLTSYLHALPILVGLPVIVGVSVWSLGGLFLSGLATFGWLRSAGLGVGAVQGGLVYMIAPYRLIDLYHRSALAEHWAFVWPPLILWVATAARLPAPVRAALVAGSVAMLLLSNIPLATLFGLGLGVWFVASGRLRGRRSAVAAGTVLGFGAAAFALVPQAMSSSLLAVDRYYGAGAGRFRPSANTLFSGDVHAFDFNTLVSVSLVAVVLLVVLAFAALPPEGRRQPVARTTMVASLLLLLATSGPAGALWETLPLLSRFQFPWRVAALLTLNLAVMTAFLPARRGWCLVALVVAVSVPFSGWGRTVSRDAFSAPEPAPVAAGTVFPDPRTAWEAGSGGWYWRHHALAEIWFLPRSLPAFLLPDLAGSSAPQLDPIRDRAAVLVEAPAAPVRVLLWRSTRRVVEIDAPRAGRLLWRAIAFPEMMVTVDGLPVPVNADPVTGLVTHHLGGGVHRVEWSWSPFPALRWARRVTAVSLAIVVTLLAVGLAGASRLGSGALRSAGGEAGDSPGMGR